jgi:hypothetical protein
MGRGAVEPPRWRRKVPLRAAGELRFVLRRETSARMSLSSFVGQYLPLLDFPADVLEALSAGRVNLFEAMQLARLTPERLDARNGICESVPHILLKHFV